MKKYMNAGLLFTTVLAVVIIRSEVSKVSYSVYTKNHLATSSEYEREKLSVQYAREVGVEQLALGLNKMVSLKAPKVSQVVHISQKGIALTR